MIRLIKDHLVKFFLIIGVLILDIAVIFLALIKTDQEISCPGGLDEVKSLIKTDSNTVLKGSFNTIYVYGIDEASILQTWIALLADYNEIEEMNPSFHLSKEEMNTSGRLLKTYSIETSILCAYLTANKIDQSIDIEAKLMGYTVYNRQINHKTFKIGDLITQIYSISDKALYDAASGNLAKALNNLTIGDIVTVIRDGKTLEITFNENISSDNQNHFYCFYKYDINEESAKPKFTIYPSNNQGSSGGLLQTLSVYSQITGIDLTNGLKVCGTGTINLSGKVGEIGSVSQKIVTAIHNKADIFLCPSDNYEEAYATYKKTPGHKKMKLIEVSTLEEAIWKLGKYYES